MCYSGSIQSIGRHGISGSKSSVFARAAFEVTVNQLLDAGLYGEEERLLGIPENVIVGQISPIGSGRVNVAVNTELKGYKSKKKEITKTAIIFYYIRCYCIISFIRVFCVLLI